MKGIKHNILKIYIISILVSNFICVASIYDDNSQNRTRIRHMDNQNISKSTLPNECSSIVELDGLKYTVNNISRRNSNGIKQASNGRMFICVDMDVENNKGASTEITSVMNFSLTDTSGNWFNVVMPEGNDSFNGQLPKGTTKSGKVYFDVDVNTTNFILTFRSRISGDKSITINSHGEIINNHGDKNHNNNDNNDNNDKNNNNDNNNNNNNNNDNHNNDNENEKYESEYELSHTVNCDYFRFNIGNIKVSNYYNGNFAKDGFKFVYIDVEAENTEKYQEQITSSFIFALRDDNDNYYSVKLPEENGINSTINPNQKLSGKIVFEVKESSSSFTMIIKPWSYKDHESLIDFNLK